MADKKNKWLSKILTTVADSTPIGGLIKHGGAMISDIQYGANREKGVNKLKKKYLNKLMDRYPKSISDSLKVERRKQIKKMVYDGKFKEAKKFVDNKRNEYIKLNYIDLGLQIPEYLQK